MATLTRRTVLTGSAAAGFAVFASPLRAAAPAAEAITPTLVDAAKKEGKVVFYTAMDLPVAEKLAKAFETAYAGVAVRVERSGSERLFQRIGQERASNISAVDVCNSADAAHFIVWKRNGWLDAYMPDEVARHFPAEFRDGDGMHVTSRIYFCSLGYNTDLVKPEEAPKSYADLLDPKWAGKMVKGHPAYSGTIMTGNVPDRARARLGLSGKAVEAAGDAGAVVDRPAEEAGAGRARRDGGRRRLQCHPVQGAGQAGGSRLSRRGRADRHRSDRPVQGGAQSQCRPPVPQLAAHTRGTAISGRLHRPAFGARAGARRSRGARRLADIKAWKDDAAGVEKAAEEIKAKYQQLFRV